MTNYDSLLADFARDGYVVIRQVVNSKLVARIAERTNAEFSYWQNRMFPVEAGEGGIFLPDWDERHAALSSINDAGVIQAFLGEVADWFSTVVVIEPQTEPLWPLGRMHIDRPPTTDPSRQWPSFSLSIGIGIQGGDRPNSGSLGVFPGSHRLCEAHFRNHPEQNLWNCLTGERSPKTDRPIVDISFVGETPLVEVLLEPGDIVCTHSLLAHTTMPNLSGARRIAKYFAFIHSAHSALGNEFVRSIWDYWPSALKEHAGRLRHPH